MDDKIQTIRNLFHDALALPLDVDRVKWVERRCQGESGLLLEVVSLLDAHAKMIRKADVPDVPEMAVPATLFGAYRAVRIIGRGGMSTVYLAQRADGQFEQTVALKIMASYLAGPEFLRRFAIERQLLAGLTHNNITRLIDGGVSSSGDPYLITEYVNGRTIDRYCDEEKLDVTRRLRIFLYVCEAVDYAHRNLIVHRDLKPGNIMVNEEGTVKLLDFGTAVLLAAEGDITATRARMLTPRYASPEQLRGERVNVSTDIFSLGVVLYELLVGAWPFGDPGSVVSELNRAVGNVSAKPPSTAVTEEAARSRSASKENLRAMLNGDLTPIVMKALESNPSGRYESVRQFATDIERYLDGRPVQARRQTVLYRARRFVRRHWLSVGAAAIFIVGLSTAIVITMRQAQLARIEARRALDEAQKSARVTAFLRSMLTSATQVGGGDVTVLQMLNAAEPDIERSWKDDPLAEATLRASLGTTYVTLAQHDRARLQLQKALTLFQSLGRHVDAADTLLVLGINSQGGTEAVGYYRQALAELALAGPQAAPALMFRLKVYLAGNLKDFHNIAEARTLVEEAIGLMARIPAIPAGQRSAAFEIRGETLLEEGRFDEADAQFRQAISINPHEFDAGVMLARSSYLREKFPEATAFARRNFEMAEGYGLEDQAEAEMWWARYRAESGEAAQALVQLREAIPRVRDFYRHGYLVAYYAEPAARILNKTGNFAEAVQFATQALHELQACQMPENHPLTAASLEDLGEALCGLNRTREGVPALEKAVGIYQQLGPAYTALADRAGKVLMQAKAR